MADAIADTGPFLHLTEIGWLDILSIFDQLTVPNLVADELRAFEHVHCAWVMVEWTDAN